MKSLQVVFSILILGLSGCAYTGYQRSYAGYGSGYSGSYGTGAYYNYPAQTYYQPGGVIRYQQNYMPSGYPQRHDWSGSGHRQGGVQQHWDSGRSGPPHRPLDRAWEAQAEKRQHNSDSRRSWQPERESRSGEFGSLGRLQHRSGAELLGSPSQERRGFDRRHD